MLWYLANRPRTEAALLRRLIPQWEAAGETALAERARRQAEQADERARAYALILDPEG